MAGYCAGNFDGNQRELNWAFEARVRGYRQPDPPAGRAFWPCGRKYDGHDFTGQALLPAPPP